MKACLKADGDCSRRSGGGTDREGVDGATDFSHLSLRAARFRADFRQVIYRALSRAR